MPLHLSREGSPSAFCLTLLLTSLALLAGCASTASLIEDTQDPFAGGRREAVAELGLREGTLDSAERQAAIAAIERALTDEDPAVRATAVEALGNFSEFAATDALLATFRDPHPRVRAAAARTAGRLKLVEALSELLQLAGLDREEDVRREAVNAVAKLGEKAAVPTLIDLLEREESRVKYVINDALRRLTGKIFPPTVRDWRRWYDSQG